MFIGNVRGENLGRRVVELHYEAYEPLALNAFGIIAAEAGAAVAGRGRRDPAPGRPRSASATRAS
ncbi:MAG: molybdenum cofactor biosynthesis protein MoaE [Candidatus Moduliflexus flocculans]|nr:molybdenum cofactor biosynthesis protein MoaE [Candidatus Moduliflexus flocculans]